MEQCLNCSAGCCRALNPPLLGCDILKITKSLGVSPFLFTIALPLEGEKLEKNLGKAALFKFKDLQEGAYYKLILKAIPSMIATNKCVFQLEWKSDEDGKVIGRCGIHSIRPIVCRTFPARITDDLNPVMEDPHIVYNHKKKTDSFWENPNYSMCPRPLKPEDYSEFREDYYRDVHIQEYETKFFLQLADKWNENPGLSDDFLAFLEKEYENRLPIAEYPKTCS